MTALYLFALLYNEDISSIEAVLIKRKNRMHFIVNGLRARIQNQKRGKSL